MEDCRRAHLILDRDGLILGPDAHVHIPKVELLLHKDTLRLCYLSNASELFVSSILNLHREGLFVDSGSRRFE